MSSLRTLAYTAFALVAFAANSVLCRLALGEETIDAASFSTIRLVSGALTLVLVSALLQEKRAGHSANWVSAVVLFLYAVPFSYAYVTLSTGTGALILFAAVQSTMIVAALWGGERPVPREWGGLGAALAGLVYLVFPGLTAPDPAGFRPDGAVRHRVGRLLPEGSCGSGPGRHEPRQPAISFERCHSPPH